MIDDLLACARQLSSDCLVEPTQANLRRAVSTAYYAMFHSLARTAANSLTIRSSAVDNDAWTKIYRGLQHGLAKESCRSAAAAGFAHSIIDFAEAFVELQEERHKADYDPNDRLSWLVAGTLVDRASRGIERLNNTSGAERRDFAIHVLFRSRSG